MQKFATLTTERRFAAAGSWVLILWGIGHIVTIDILPLLFGIYLYDIDRHMLDLMHVSILRFPYTGQTNLFVAFYGLSVWLGTSLTSLGALNLIIARGDTVLQGSRRIIYFVDCVLTLAFLVISALCFFAIPVIGGAIALLLFILAFVTS